MPVYKILSYRQLLMIEILMILNCLGVIEKWRNRRQRVTRNVVTQYSDVTRSAFYTDHLFYFFMFINHSFFCLLFKHFHVLMSIKYYLFSVVAYYLLASLIRRSWCIKKQMWVPLSNFFVEHLSVLLQNTSQYICRQCINIFKKRFSLVS